MVVTGAILFRGVTPPWRFELWQAKQHAGRGYRKVTEIAALLIRDFTPPGVLKVRVLFDAFYLSPVVIQACAECCFHWFSVATRNRAFTPAGGVRGELAESEPRLAEAPRPLGADAAGAGLGVAADRGLGRPAVPDRRGAAGRLEAAARALAEHGRDRDR